MARSDRTGFDMSVEAFLKAQGWDGAHHDPLAGDASARRYIRLRHAEKRAVLMIDPDGDTDRFAQISTFLSMHDLSAPKIYAWSDHLMLLEDLGDAQVARYVHETPQSERSLYAAATDVLCHLETCAPPAGLCDATPEYLGQLIDLAFTAYLPAFGMQPGTKARDITLHLTDLLAQHLPTDRVFVHRDYHAENLIWLPDRAGLNRIGVLDFQDALSGPPVYDLASLLLDARRDVSATCHDVTVAHYLNRSGRDAAVVLPAFHLLGVQRNLRILGVFARLAKERGKPAYLSLIPRVWGHIQKSLQAPVLAELAPLIDSVFPTPTPNDLAKAVLA